MSDMEHLGDIFNPRDYTAYDRPTIETTPTLPFREKVNVFFTKALEVLMTDPNQPLPSARVERMLDMEFPESAK